MDSVTNRLPFLQAASCSEKNKTEKDQIEEEAKSAAKEISMDTAIAAVLVGIFHDRRLKIKRC